MTFNDFINKHNSKKNKATSNLKLNEVLKKIALDSKVRVYLRDGVFSRVIGIVNLHLTIGIHLVCYIHHIFFDSYCCAPPRKLSRFIIKGNGFCFYSE